MKYKLWSAEAIESQQKAIIKTITGIDFPFRDKDISTALVRASSLQDADQYLQGSRLLFGLALDNASGRLLDIRGKENSKLRFDPSYATVNLEVYRVVGTVGDVVIPINTIVYVPPAGAGRVREWKTKAATTILNGQPKSPAVAVEATQFGDEYNNIAIGASYFLKNPINKVDYALSTTLSSGGLDQESDADFRQRIKLHWAMLAKSNDNGIEGAIRNVTSGSQRVISAWIQQDFISTRSFIVWIDDGSGVPDTIGPPAQVGDIGSGADVEWDYTASGGEFLLQLPRYPVNKALGIAQGMAPPGFILEKDGAPLTEGVDFSLSVIPGLIAMAAGMAGGSVYHAEYWYRDGLVWEASQVLRANKGTGTWGSVSPVVGKTDVNVTGTLFFREGYNTSYGLQIAIDMITNYINQVGIGEPVLLSALHKVAMTAPGAYRFDLVTPTINTYPASPLHVCRAGTINVT